MAKKFYKCNACGVILEAIGDVDTMENGCKMEMEELVPNTSEGAGEKHLPVVTVEKNTVHVKVGEVAHPMADEHYIQWVYLETENGCQRKNLKPNETPEATFYIGEEKPVAVYEYCNLHGFWKTEIEGDRSK